MPIADCGFGPLGILPGRGGQPQIVPGTTLLMLNGPTTQVEIGFDEGFFDKDPARVQQALAAANPTPRLLHALIDTGARESAIDEELAKELQLPMIDRQEGSGIGGTEKFDVYLGHIRIAALGGFVQYGRFMGIRLRAGGQPHQAILGRTVLQSTILVYDGRDGTCRLAV